LETDPVEEIDFGSSKDQHFLFINNTGNATLVYAIYLPGDWITTTAPLQRQLAPAEQDTVPLEIDREEIPWLGPGVGELVISSNGLTNSTHAGVVKLSVKVLTDASCTTHQDCHLSGYYCDSTEGAGICKQLKSQGNECETGVQCTSGMCIEAFCCDSQCEGGCETCALEGEEGTCQPVSDGDGCEDGDLCTAGDVCQNGACNPGTSPDCADFDNPCGPGSCEPESGQCASPSTEDRCLIDDQCLDQWTWHPMHSCLQCLPGKSAAEWSVTADRCFVDGQCWDDGDEIGSVCQLCDAQNPNASTPVPDDTPCTSDDNECTADTCVEGACTHLALTGAECNDQQGCTHSDVCNDGLCEGMPYICDDGLDCTDDSCNGDETCAIVVHVGNCVIDEQCVEHGQFLAGTGKCSLCDSGQDPQGWSHLAEGQWCDDGDGCTEEDQCAEGVCVGMAKVCDDGLDCTADWCAEGICAAAPEPGSCLIEGGCVEDQAVSPENPCQACLTDQSQEQWSAFNVGTDCQLPQAIAQCGPDGQCVLIQCSEDIYGDCNEDSAVGVRFVHSSEGVVAHSSFLGITGGAGSNHTWYCGSAKHCGYQPSGGLGAAVSAQLSQELMIVGNGASGIIGGTGGPIGPTGDNIGGAGGVGAAIWLSASPGAFVSANRFMQVAGGHGVAGPGSLQQVGFGIYLDEGSWAGDVPMDNSLDGDIIVFLHGVDGLSVTGLSLVQDSQPTNWGKIAVVNSENVTIEANVIANYEGETGTSTTRLSTGSAMTFPGEPARGIYLHACNDCQVRNNQVSEILGGRGGARFRPFWGQQSGTGGTAAGIEAEECEGLSALGNEVASVTGNAGGAGSLGEGGPAWGFRLAGGSVTEFSNNLVHDIVSLNYVAGLHGPAACIRMDEAAQGIIDHLTCYGVGDEESTGYGIMFSENQLAKITVRSSIFSTVSDFCVKGLAGVPGLLAVYYSTLHNCSSGTGQDATVLNSIEEDPMFVLPEEGNFHLQSGSPCIDTGAPSLDCNLEPVPNGCQVNMGAYGNTEEAAAKFDADHCSPCP
jgi:hypothetical protein